jgi:hypothetical protein
MHHASVPAADADFKCWSLAANHYVSGDFATDSNGRLPRAKGYGAANRLNDCPCGFDAVLSRKERGVAPEAGDRAKKPGALLQEEAVR